MPVIDPYFQQVLPQGGLNVRATSDAFGGQVGAAMVGLGSTITDGAERQLDLLAVKDVTEAHKSSAAYLAKWVQAYQTRLNQTTPGDDTFLSRLSDDMEQDASDNSPQFQTRRGRDTWDTLTANIRSEFVQRAVQDGAKLAGDAARGDYESLKQSLGAAVYGDPSKLPLAQMQAQQVVDDPASMFSKVPQATRNDFKRELTNTLNFSAASGLAKTNPGVILQSLDPKALALFRPWENLLASSTVQGGHLDISPETMAQAPATLAQAASKDINPAVLLAQRDIGSGDRDPKDQASDMAVLLNRYGGDYTKALAAYQMGTVAFDQVMQKNGALWAANLPQDVTQYVNDVMRKAGQVPGPEPAASVESAAPRLPVASSLAALSGLTWEQQQRVINEAVQVQHLQLTMATKAREEAQIQLQKQQDEAMNGIIQKIVAPGQYGAVKDSDILANPTLSWQQKQHAIDYMATRRRELRSDAESASNPAEVRRLMLQIHAADDDPTKTYNMDPVMASYRAGRISTHDMMLLRGEVEQMKNGDGSGFGKRLQMAREAAYQGFTRSLEGGIQPEKAIGAWYAFIDDLDKQVAAMRAKNENPATLLDPMSRDYVLKPERLKGFMQVTPGALADGAAKQVAAATADAARQQQTGFGGLPTYKDYDRLKSGDQYTDPQGRIRRKQ